MTAAANRIRQRQRQRLRLRRVVYWSALVPAAGASLLDECPPPYVELFSSLASASPDNTVSLPFAVWQGAFVQDADEQAQRIVHALLPPQPMQYFTASVAPLDVEVPFDYVLSVDDIAMPPGEFGGRRASSTVSG
jgi:hypothetical protein